MSFFARLGQSIVLPLIELWNSFISTLPYVLGGMLIAIFGYLLGSVIGVISENILKRLHFNSFVHRLELSPILEKIDLDHFVGTLLKWYVFVVFLVPAASLARLGEVSVLLLDFARWVPDLILGVLIVLFGWIAFDIVAHKVEHTRIHSKKAISLFVRILGAVIVFVIALENIGVNVTLIQQTFLILLTAFAFGVALAIGIGFGLGMKDDAKKFVQEFKQKNTSSSVKSSSVVAKTVTSSRTPTRTQSARKVVKRVKPKAKPKTRSRAGSKSTSKRRR